MPKTIRFHLDEQANPTIAAGLRRHGINVTTTADAGLLGASDEEHVAYAVREARVIFTQDKDFLRMQDAGVPHAGIAYCRQQSRTLGQIMDSGSFGNVLSRTKSADGSSTFSDFSFRHR
jgi:hypothetical protein